MLYLISVIFYILYFIFLLVFFYISSCCFYLIGKSYYKELLYTFPKSSEHNNFIKIILLFKDLSKKQAYMFVYFFLKKKVYNFTIFRNAILSYILRFLFFLVFGFNVKTVKITAMFLNIFFKNKKNTQKYKSFSSFFETIFIDFVLLYNDYFNEFVKKSKIIIHKKSILLNPKSYVDLLKEILNSKFKLSNEDLLKIAECLQIIKDEADIRYIFLQDEINKNYPGVLKQDKNGRCFISEYKPHTSLEISYSQNSSLLIRETTKKEISIKSVLNVNNVNVETNSSVKTGFASTGSINTKLVAYKTPIIGVKQNQIFYENNSKLIDNIREGLTNKNLFLAQLIGSMFKPIYIFDKGNLYKDPKYINLHNKILNDSEFIYNRNELTNALADLSNIWHNHFEKFADIPNEEVFNTIINFIAGSPNIAIDPSILQAIADMY